MLYADKIYVFIFKFSWSNRLQTKLIGMSIIKDTPTAQTIFVLTLNANRYLEQTD